MTQGLQAGAGLVSEITGSGYEVERLLGEGGQGQVWKVFPRRSPGDVYALKWYFPHSGTEDQHRALARLVEMGPPDQRFLWPLELVRAEASDGFGYIMELRSAEFHGMAELMRRTIEPTFAALATAAFDLADGFLELHARGLCYLDISFGNVFLEPGSGHVLICDNDNVRVDGEPAPIAGTPKFMAPEVVADLVAGRIPTPNRTTDLFSLSVLLFYMFMMHHPFEGKLEADIGLLDAAAQNRLYGLEPVFIFHPDDDRNRPVPGYHDNPLVFWPLYPQFLRNLFTQAFTSGVDQPEHGRVQESQWRRAMVRLRDSIALCPACRAEVFIDPDRPEAKTCWSCAVAVEPPARIEIGSGRPDTVMLNGGARLYPHHTLRDRYDFSRPTAEVASHPAEPGVWGLKNLGREIWNATTADGESWPVEPGRSITLSDGLIVDFGRTRGKVSGGPIVARDR